MQLMPILEEDADFLEGYFIVVICVECKDGHDPANDSGTRMQAVSGSYIATGGFIFECPRCGRQVALAYVEPRMAEKIELISSKILRKSKGRKRNEQSPMG